MAKDKRNLKDVLVKLKIEALNPMQEAAYTSIQNDSEVILLSPTGSGKTLAFLLPLLEVLDPEVAQIQALILAPSRELAIQIEQVAREIGSGFKVNCVYGGRSGFKDKIDLKHPPAILIGTPGRIADHIRNEVIDTTSIHTLILDEYDKSMQIGFEKDMTEIVNSLTGLKRKILTSATFRQQLPDFISIKSPNTLNFLKSSQPDIAIKIVESNGANRLKQLESLLHSISDGNGIIFCNYKDSINDVSDYLYDQGIIHACFYGGLEQIDRERALVKFRNGSHNLLIATDLAARGIDVPELDFIIHFELPQKLNEFTHRNGRTARMNQNGTAYILAGKGDRLPEYMAHFPVEAIDQNGKSWSSSNMETMYISGGRRDKISKGDIAGLFLKQGGLAKDELGIIELKQECAFVSVPKEKIEELTEKLNNSKLKKKKVRISLLE